MLDGTATPGTGNSSSRWLLSANLLAIQTCRRLHTLILKPAHLRKPVVHETDLDPLAVLLDEHIARIPTLTVDGLEPPDLRRGPSVVDALDV